jgi:hypothetical protein
MSQRVWWKNPNLEEATSGACPKNRLFSADLHYSRGSKHWIPAAPGDMLATAISSQTPCQAR